MFGRKDHLDEMEYGSREERECAARIREANAREAADSRGAEGADPRDAVIAELRAQLKEAQNAMLEGAAKALETHVEDLPGGWTWTDGKFISYGCFPTQEEAKEWARTALRPSDCFDDLVLEWRDHRSLTSEEETGNRCAARVRALKSRG